MNAKIGNLAKPKSQVYSSFTCVEAAKLFKLSAKLPKDVSSLGWDAPGSKYGDIWGSQKPIFPFICVYRRRS